MQESRVSWALALFALTILLAECNASTSPATQSTDSEFGPRVTVDGSGQASTATPVVSIIDGAATTLEATAAKWIATTTTTADPPATTTSTDAESTSIGGGAFPVCDNISGDYAPFCLPIQSAFNGTTLYVSKTYYITFDSNYTGLSTAPNASIAFQGTYINATDETSQTQAFQHPAYVGYYPLTITKDFLQGQSSNQIRLFLTYAAKSITGPTITVMTEPPTYFKPKPAKATTGPSLYITLPTMLSLVCVCVVGGFLINRKHRMIGLGNVMGRRKGYGVGKSRGQRLGLGKKSGAVELREQELSSDGVYRDVPVERETRPSSDFRSHRRHDTESLEDVVDSSTEEGYGHDGFQDEPRGRTHGTF